MAMRAQRAEWWFVLASCVLFLVRILSGEGVDAVAKLLVLELGESLQSLDDVARVALVLARLDVDYTRERRRSKCSVKP